MRLLAKKLREKAEEAEEEKVDVRREDKTIRPFTINIPDNLPPKILTISSYKVIKNHKAVERTCDITIPKNYHLQLVGPNGIGKSTLLESLASGHAKGETLSPQVKIGYYRQDFSTLNFNETVFETLMASMEKKIEEDRSEERRVGKECRL